MNKKITVLISFIVLLSTVTLFFKFDSINITDILNSNGGGKWLLPLIGVTALIDSTNPCAFSVLLITIAFLSSIGRDRSNILKIGGAYIFGIFSTYILIGLGIMNALHVFNTPHFMAKVGAFILISVGGINIINHFFPKFPIKLGIPHVAHRKIAEIMEKASFPAAIVLGILVGLSEFPCTGGPYLMVLGLLHDSGTYLEGFGYLLFYNLIFVLPLVIFLFIASDSSLIGKVQEWKKEETGKMKVWGGIAMIILGVLVFIIQ